MEKMKSKLQDKTWIDTQEPEFINLLTQYQDAINLLASQVMLFIDLLQDFQRAADQTIIIKPEDAPENAQNG